MVLKFCLNYLSFRKLLVDSGIILYFMFFLFLLLLIWCNIVIGCDKFVLNINCKIFIDKKVVFVMEFWFWIFMRYVIMNLYRIFLMVGILVLKFFCYKFCIKRNDFCFCYFLYGKVNVKLIYFIII